MAISARVRNCLVSTILMISYLIAGMYLFLHLERDKEGQSTTVSKLQTILANLKQLESLIGSCYSDVQNCAPLEDINAVINNTRRLTVEYLLEESKHNFPWSLPTSFHFCYTAITTIGYGYITPSTQLGRGLAIPYILFGLPINLFFSVNFGYFVARGICKIYSISARLVRILFHRRHTLGVETEITPRIEVDLISISEKFRNGRDSGLERAPARFEHPTISQTNDNVGLSIPGECPQVNLDSPPTTSRDRDSIKHRPIENLNEETENPDESYEEECKAIPLWFLGLFLSALTLLISYVMYTGQSSNWTFLDALYFVIVTFTTIGFGDMELDTSKSFGSNLAIWWNILYLSLLMQFGLVMMAGFITILSEKVATKLKDARESIKRKLTCSQFIGKTNDGDVMS